jgi:hypothetical protein
MILQSNSANYVPARFHHLYVPRNGYWQLDTRDIHDLHKPYPGGSAQYRADIPVLYPPLQFFFAQRMNVTRKLCETMLGETHHNPTWLLTVRNIPEE